MFIHHNKLKTHIADSIYQCIEREFGESIELKVIYEQLIPAPNLQMGHLAFGCFILSKELKRSPSDIAQFLMNKIKLPSQCLSSTCSGPYLNFTLNAQELLKDLNLFIDGDYYKAKLTKDAPKTMIEFSQPNTHKELHVGHMRNMCLGDALINIYRYCGIETISTSFPGDVGTHVAKCLWYYKLYNQENEVPSVRKGAWLGSLYTKATIALSDKEVLEKNKPILTQILKEIEAKNGEYYHLWKQTRQWSIDLMQNIYDFFNIQFDCVYWESDVDRDSVEYIQQLYQQGKLVKDDGAIGLDLSADKLGFCLLLKSDGTGLYATKDIELARRKFEEHKVDKSIYVVDNRQAFHFKQVFKSLEKIGFTQAQNCYHLQYEMVELPDGAMSSRKGNIVPIQSLVDEMLEKIKTDYLNKYRDQWSAGQINETARKIANAAIRFGMTKLDNNKKIVFDMQEWLKLDGESGPYIQYSYARIRSILNKIQVNENHEPVELKSDKEVELLLKLFQFNDTVEAACKQNKTQSLTSYLYDLSKSFNSFYAECSVANAETAQIQYWRLKLCEATASHLKQGLALLGIECPERM